MKTPEASRRLSGSRRSRFQPETMSAPSSRPLEQGRDVGRIVLTVAVDGDDRAPPRLGESGGQRRRLAEVAAQPHPPQPGPLGRQLLDQLEGAVGGAVVDDDHLPGSAQLGAGPLDLLEQRGSASRSLSAGITIESPIRLAHGSGQMRRGAAAVRSRQGTGSLSAGTRSSAGRPVVRLPTWTEAEAKRRTDTAPPAPLVSSSAPPRGSRAVTPKPAPTRRQPGPDAWRELGTSFKASASARTVSIRDPRRARRAREADCRRSRARRTCGRPRGRRRSPGSPSP